MNFTTTTADVAKQQLRFAWKHCIVSSLFGGISCYCHHYQFPQKLLFDEALGWYDVNATCQSAVKTSSLRSKLSCNVKHVTISLKIRLNVQHQICAPLAELDVEAKFSVFALALEDFDTEEVFIAKWLVNLNA